MTSLDEEIRSARLRLQSWIKHRFSYGGSIRFTVPREMPDILARLKIRDAPVVGGYVVLLKKKKIG